MRFQSYGYLFDKTAHREFETCINCTNTLVTNVIFTNHVLVKGVSTEDTSTPCKNAGDNGAHNFVGIWNICTYYAQSDEGLTALKASVEGDLASLATWLKNNGLKVNPSKTEMSLFGTLPVTKKASVWKFQRELWKRLFDTSRTDSIFGSPAWSKSDHGEEFPYPS